MSLCGGRTPTVSVLVEREGWATAAAAAAAAGRAPVLSAVTISQQPTATLACLNAMVSGGGGCMLHEIMMYDIGVTVLAAIK